LHNLLNRGLNIATFPGTAATDRHGGKNTPFYPSKVFQGIQPFSGRFVGMGYRIGKYGTFFI
jgi:hypothetical protein